MLRAVLLIHRYLGIAGCALMLLWCASGFVMMYVAYPSLTEERRLAGLKPLDFSRLAARLALSPPSAAAPFNIEMLDGQPVMRVMGSNEVRLVSLRTGQPLKSVSQAQAARVARDFLPALAGAEPELLGRVTRDQWTVSEHFGRERPFYLFALSDADRTRVYVSGVTGRVVQATSAQQRFWNWLGPIPHWLYLRELRQQPKLWQKVVIGAGLIGSFLSLTGLYLGLQGLPWRRSAAPGRLRWHHASGLLFGIFALSWVFTGLLSVQPWGFLESRSSARAALATEPAPDLPQAIRTLSPQLGRSVVSIGSAALGAEPFFVATTGTGKRERFNISGQSAPLGTAEVDAFARRLGSRVPVLRLTQEDDFWFSHHDERIALPVYRVALPDPEHGYLYLNAVTGLIEAQVDRNARAQRWVDGVHRFDLTPTLRARPLWDVLVMLALAGVSCVSVTGAWLAARRLSVGRAEVRVPKRHVT